MNLTVFYDGKTYQECERDYLLSKGVPTNIINSAEYQQHKNNQLALINQHCQNELNVLTNTYPSGEVSTFDKQETEARAYLADNAAATPLLDALAFGRGIDKTELIDRVIAKADVFSAASGAIIGKRQKLEDELNALSEETHSIDDIAAITW